MRDNLLDIYRAMRVRAKQVCLLEPVVRLDLKTELEFHGNNYCGWKIPRRAVHADSVVVDVGLGENVSFSKSLIDRYGCTVHGFDPTPRAIRYVNNLAYDKMIVYDHCLGASAGRAKFYLPNNRNHVSGSLAKVDHVGIDEIDVELVTIKNIFEILKIDRIDLLKLDIEGSEYEVIASDSFRTCAPRIGLLCIEFHHRWQIYGRKSTREAVKILRGLGFLCAWRSVTNEEFLFVNQNGPKRRGI